MLYRSSERTEPVDGVSRCAARSTSQPHPSSSEEGAEAKGWRVASWLALACGAVAAVRISLNSGVTLDEEVHRRYGKAIAAWFRSGFSDDTATTVAQRFYGGLFDLLGHRVVSLSGGRLGTFELLHVFTALVALGGVVLTWKLAQYVAGPRAGLLAALFLALTPAWVGHGMFNSKDIPFAVGVTLVLFGSARIALQLAPLSLSRALAAGAFCGVALGVRPGGLFVLSFPAIAAVVRLALDARAEVGRGMPTWFAITLPELYWVALGCALLGLVAWLRGRRSTPRSIDPPKTLCVGLYVAAVIAPLAGVLIMRPILYDAQRHFLFVLPPLAAVAGIATSHVLHGRRFARWLRAAVATTCVALAVLVWIDMRELHPYQYVYFNRSFGGLPRADGRFETDYWGAANREGLAWVVSNIEVAPGAPPVRVATCDLPWQVAYYLKLWDRRDSFTAVRDADADILVAMTRDNCHDKPGEVLHKVERQGVPLGYVIRRASNEPAGDAIGGAPVDPDPNAVLETGAEGVRVL